MGRPDSIMLYAQRQRLLRRCQKLGMKMGSSGCMVAACPMGSSWWAQAGGTGHQQVIKAQGTGLVLTHGQTEVGSV